MSRPLFGVARLASMVALLVVAGLLVTGCYRTTLVFDPHRAAVFPAAEISHTYMMGVVGLDGPINLHGLCPNGIARIDQWESPLGVVVRTLSGVVGMRDAEIHCRAGEGEVRAEPHAPARAAAIRP